MQLLPAYGRTIDEITSDGFEVSDRVYMSLEGHNHFTMCKSLGVFLSSFIDVLGRIRPDWLILAGDRGEQLMGAVAGAYTYTPVAHIQAGEVSGNIDGVARHAIARFVHLHFASNEDAGERLRRAGEEEFRIHVVGAPQLDELVQGDYPGKEELGTRFGLNLEEPYILIVQHPVTEEMARADEQAEALLNGINQFDLPKIWVMPNNDAGCLAIRNRILAQRRSDTQIFPNLKRKHFLGLMKHAACVVGNSSAGLLEAPTFKVPAVNLGRRQVNRVRGKNVIDCEFSSGAIVEAIQKALSPGFRAILQHCLNPYGDGRSSERILEILQSTPIDERLLIKQLTY
jgi:GDP/UDP-N,N'-diacetylbacillosamine 2-epimerase (hydrolysing)